VTDDLNMHIFLSGRELRFDFQRVLSSSGHAMAQLVETLRYETEGRGFDSRWCHWNFSLT
jgi:hypothetical protein